MAEFCGGMGTILNVDLTRDKIEKVPLSPEFADNAWRMLNLN